MHIFYLLMLCVLSYLSSILCTFTCVFILQVMFKPKEQRMSKKGPKRSTMKKIQEHVAAQKSHAVACCALIEKTREGVCRGMPCLCRSTRNVVRLMVFRVMPQHDYPCRSMMVQIFLVFLKVGFNTFQDFYYNPTSFTLIKKKQCPAFFWPTSSAQLRGHQSIESNTKQSKIQVFNSFIFLFNFSPSLSITTFEEMLQS